MTRRIPEAYLRREPLDAIVHGTYRLSGEPAVPGDRERYPVALSFLRLPDSYQIELSLDLSVFRRAYRARNHTVDEERAWLAAAVVRARAEHQGYPMVLGNVAARLYHAFLPGREAHALSRRLSRSAEATFAPVGPWNDVPHRFTDYVLRATTTLPTPVEPSFIQVLDRLVADLWILSPQYLELRYHRRNPDRAGRQCP